MWSLPRLLDLITARLDTPLIPTGLEALSTLVCQTGKLSEKKSKERTGGKRT